MDISQTNMQPIWHPDVDRLVLISCCTLINCSLSVLHVTHVLCVRSFLNVCILSLSHMNHRGTISLVAVPIKMFSGVDYPEQSGHCLGIEMSQTSPAKYATSDD